MKKNLFIATLVASSMGFVSCSDDDNSNNNGNNNPDVELFASSNTSGMISYTDLTAPNTAARMFGIGSTDVDGIYFDDDRNEVIVASRSNDRLEVYGNVREALASTASTLEMVATSATGDFTNAREIAVDGNRVVVVDDVSATSGKIFVYQRVANGFTLEKSFDIAFKLWGIDIEDGHLYAVEDSSSRIAVFNNIFSKSNGALTPDKVVAIEGLVRTHGINFADDDNTMLLTDVGSALSDSDGGIIVIENWNTVFTNTTNGGTIPLTAQKRIYGPNSLLGNPVDISFDDDANRIYVAERLNGGGRILSFAYPTTAQGDATPIMNRPEAGATAVYIRD